MEHQLIKKAREMAYWAHEGQVRPNSGQELKIRHLEEVARLVAYYGGSVDEIVAAWLHDILEDTVVTKQEVISVFGEDIGKIVVGLTDKPSVKNLSILERKCMQALEIAKEGSSVKIVKMADQISNVCSVQSDPPIEWKTHECIEYIDGAKIVVEKCKEANWQLYSHFLIVHLEALEYFQTLI